MLSVQHRQRGWIRSSHHRGHLVVLFKKNTPKNPKSRLLSLGSKKVPYIELSIHDRIKADSCHVWENLVAIFSKNCMLALLSLLSRSIQQRLGENGLPVCVHGAVGEHLALLFLGLLDLLFLFVFRHALPAVPYHLLHLAPAHGAQPAQLLPQLRRVFVEGKQVGGLHCAQRALLGGRSAALALGGSGDGIVMHDRLCVSHRYHLPHHSQTPP
mmetsp:Transcript_23743/g.45233  ORF Transcript_23743/g.45233 Transcript_23743/m.45233 type:complete len:213 (-) Transcript_23743:102-740(-)